MAPHENLFFVEKHYNDSLYRGQRPGTTHTDREIQAAANLWAAEASSRTSAPPSPRDARARFAPSSRARAGNRCGDGDVVILGVGGGGKDATEGGGGG